MVNIFRFIFGYLKVAFYSGAENALNLTAKNSISFWDTKLISNGIEGYISIKDFKKIAYLQRPKGMRVHILGRYGLPFKIKSNKRKVRTLTFLITFFGLLIFLSRFIWSVEIVGNEKTPDSVILSALNELGIGEGTPIKNITPKINREQLLLKVNSLSWCSLNVEGSHLTVNVSEITEKEKNDMPTNLVAEFDGTIKKINVITGNCVVKVDDTVAKGDVLVSGISETPDGTKFVVSKGEIIAETISEFTVSDTFLQTYTEPTGKTKIKRVLDFFTFKIPLYLGSEVNKYESETEVKNATLFGAKLPIRIYEKEFAFTNTYTKTLTEAELLEKLNCDLESLLREKGFENFEIIERKTQITNDTIALKALVKGQINIALSKEIQISA